MSNWPRRLLRELKVDGQVILRTGRRIPFSFDHRQVFMRRCGGLQITVDGEVQQA